MGGDGAARSRGAQRGLADPVDPAAPGPVPEGMVQQPDVRLECVGPRLLGHDLPQQAAHRLEQDEPVAIGRGGPLACEALGDGGKAFAREIAERERERRGPHWLGRNPSSARTNASVASTWGQWPTGSSTKSARSSWASSREPATGIGSKEPWSTRELGVGSGSRRSRSRRSYSPKLSHTACCVRALTLKGVRFFASRKSRKYPATDSSNARRW